MSGKPAKEFEASAKSGRRSLLMEVFDFVAHRGKWWLLPIIIVLLAIGLIIILGGTAAAPFIYTLF